MSGPDFIIPGASKSGTTSLFYYLDEHDDIFLPAEKELHYFDRDRVYEKGLDHYESQFAGAQSGQVTGEVTPSYFYASKLFETDSYKSFRWAPDDDDVPARVHEAYPDLKLVFTLRNPITRIQSQFWKNYRQGRIRAESLGEAIEEELGGRRKPSETPFCLVNNNRYSVHLERWFETFDRDQIQVLIFEEWIEEPEETLDEVCTFLGVPPRGEWTRSGERRNVGGTPRFVTLNRLYQDYLQGTALASILRQARITHLLDALNSADGYPDPTDEERRLLSEVFEPEFEEVESILGRDVDVWRMELVD